jgi:hypothetical protein
LLRGLVVRLGLNNRGGDFSCSSRSGGSGVRVSARPDISWTRTTRPPKNYGQDQEIDIQQRNARSQRKNEAQGKPVAQHEAVTLDDLFSMQTISPFDVSPEFHKLFHQVGDVQVVALG